MTITETRWKIQSPISYSCLHFLAPVCRLCLYSVSNKDFIQFLVEGKFGNVGDEMHVTHVVVMRNRWLPPSYYQVPSEGDLLWDLRVVGASRSDSIHLSYSLFMLFLKRMKSFWKKDGKNVEH